MLKIKNVVLDFGGVILDLDINKTHQEFQKFGLNNISSDHLRKNLFDFESGLINEEKITAIFKKEIPLDIDDNSFVNAWCAMLKDLPQHRVDFLYKFGKDHPLYLLSNTNSIHINFLRNRENEKFEKFEDSFTKVFYSYQMNSRKPDAVIFEQLINDLEINPKETLFVDDMLDNIETAKKLGFQTWYFDVEKDDITKLYDKL